MKNKLFKNLLLAASAFTLYACCTEPVMILPQRNINKFVAEKDSVNTNAGEVAPYQHISARDCNDARYKEQMPNAYSANTNNGVMPSSSFFKNLFGETYAKDHKVILDYLTKNLESVCWITNTSGVVSFSHAPDEKYIEMLDLPLKGNVGGTDIFYFENIKGEYVFTALPEQINSPFWDSHPWVGQDSACNLVMVWASDAQNPYSITVDEKNQQVKRGNSDIYYAFRIAGKWIGPKRIEGEKGVNTNYNEVSPYIACLNIAPKLLFSSNRDGDYDIYANDLTVDFKTMTITTVGSPELLPKGSETDLKNTYINTKSDEMFPYVALPFPQAGNKILYLSSNRNATPVAANVAGDTLVVSKGGYDLYSFEYAFDCVLPPPPPPPPAPGVTVRVSVEDKTNPLRPVVNPVVCVVEKGTNKKLTKKGAVNDFALEFGKEYEVLGGSEQNSFYCEEQGDSLLQFYRAMKVNILEPTIKKREVVTEYDSIANPKLMIAYDTTEVKEIMPATELSSFNANPVKSVVNDTAKKKEVNVTTTQSVKTFNYIPCLLPCDTTYAKKAEKAKAEQPAANQQVNIPGVEITKLVINKREWYEGGKLIKKTRRTIEFDTIPNYDTTVIQAVGTVAKSELTHVGTISTRFAMKDTLIMDKVMLTPVYYVKPPCSCDFVSVVSQYNKNVPYFQTAFWKVNTSEGYTKSLEDFQEGSYLERAGFIELHPKNRRYGVGNKEARERRKDEYREYARQVDGNLTVMRDEITKRFIPAMESLDTLSPGTKLLIKLEAYSDIRSAGVCYYIGNDVEYLQGRVDKASGNVIIRKEDIKNQATLSADNENLSKLRVFYGFNELYKRLRWDKKFLEYTEKGLVFLPNQEFKSDAEMQKALNKAKIIFLIEGKYYDQVKKEDEEDYDPVRRLNMYIDVIKYEGVRVEQSPCCSQNAKCGGK